MDFKSTDFHYTFCRKNRNLLFDAELHQKIANLALDILSWEGLFHKDGKDAIENGKWEWSYRGTLVDTIGAGASEIQKNTIAKKALNLPL